MNDRGTRRAARASVMAVAATAALGSAPAYAESIEVALKEQRQADAAAAATQQRVSDLQDEAAQMLDEYRRVLSDSDSFNNYNNRLAEQIASQDAELATIRAQLADIAVTARDVLPLMVRMVEVLEEFVELDVPFLLEERTKRVATLKAMLPRADVSFSEKYRRILEAYQIEMEFGRTLESYDGKIEDAGGARTVEFVRLGRLSLMYRTVDGKQAGYWDADKKAWARDDSYATHIRNALRVAKKQGAPDLLFAPVPAPKKVDP